MQLAQLPYRCIYSKSNAGLTGWMHRSIYDVRQLNLRHLIRNRFSGKQREFAEAIGYEPSMVSRLLSANDQTRQRIGSRMARSIEAKLRLPGNVLDVPAVESEVADYNVDPGPALRGSVPLISWIQAGAWREVIDNLQPGMGERWIGTTARVGPHAYALRIVGDSMTNPAGSPSFPEGTIIIVDPDRDPTPGRFVVVRQNHDDECTFKQLVKDGARMYLKPLNPRYPILDMGADAVVCGVLVQAVMEF